MGGGLISKIHRIHIPETLYKDGILIDADYNLTNGTNVMLGLRVHTIINGRIGHNIYDELDLICHLWMAKLMMDELEEIGT